MFVRPIANLIHATIAIGKFYNFAFTYHRSKALINMNAYCLIRNKFGQ